MRVNKIFFITVFMRAFTTGIVNARTLCIAKIRHVIAILGMLVGTGLPVLSQAANNCTGATYYDATNDTCVACPAGYTYNTDAGKTSINQCQTHCGVGTYIESVTSSMWLIPIGNEYTQLEYIQGTGSQYINTGLTSFSSDGVFELKIMPSSGNQNKFITGMNPTSGQSHVGLYYGSNSAVYYQALYRVGISVPAGTIVNITATKTGLFTDKGNASISKPTSITINEPLYVFRASNTNARFFSGRVYSYKYSENDVALVDLVPARRNSDNKIGMYDMVSNSFIAGTGNFIAGPDVTPNVCKNVSPGYWATESVINYGDVGIRNACPAGLTTVGFGHGADEANDCGPSLHIGEHVIYMRANRQTSPALHIKMPNGNTYYANMSSTDHNLSRLHLAYGGNQYTVYDESLLNAEREF